MSHALRSAPTYCFRAHPAPTTRGRNSTTLAQTGIAALHAPAAAAAAFVLLVLITVGAGGLQQRLASAHAAKPATLAERLSTARVDVVDKFFPSDNNNIGPRLGIAWDARNDGRTVVRAGYGIFYGRTPSIMIGTAHSNNLSIPTLTFLEMSITFFNLIILRSSRKCPT